MAKNFLYSIDVKSPCNESWDEMFGNDEVRFCSHCAKNVHDISAMKRSEAEKLVKNSKGGLCVRYVKNQRGELVTNPPKLTRITRRASIAATVLATSLALSSLTFAQGEPIKPRANSTDKSTKNEAISCYSTISGTVVDQNGAVIPGAKISILNAKTKEIRSILSNTEGTYEFKGVEPSRYELQAESPGFEKLLLQNIDVIKDANLEKSLTLEVSELATAAKQKSPVEISISNLPINDRKFTIVMGFFPAAKTEEKAKTEKPTEQKKKKN